MPRYQRSHLRESVLPPPGTNPLEQLFAADAQIGQHGLENAGWQILAAVHWKGGETALACPNALDLDVGAPLGYWDKPRSCEQLNELLSGQDGQTGAHSGHPCAQAAGGLERLLRG